MGNLGEALKKMWTQIQAWWAGLTLNQKVLMAAALLLLVAAVAVFSGMAVNANYVPLYTNLSLEDAASIQAKLDELGVNYKLEGGGTTILVPSDVKDKTRLELASAGLPKGVAGFDLFDQTNFGETETDKKVKYQRALQGELTRTIESMDQVEFAKVNLVIPEKTLFTEEQEEASASVLIKTKPGRELNQNQVLGIVHLVASSVEGLKPENVMVVDTSGNMLTAGLNLDSGSMYTATLTEAQMEMKKRFEKEMQYSLQSMLERILGYGKAVVRVSADLNFDEKQSTREVYGPNTYVRSEKLTEETTRSTEGTAAQGVPGTESNIPTYPEGTSGQGTSSTDKSEKIRNYEIDREEIHQKYMQGDVKRLTISVIVDRDLTQKAKQEIQDAVAAACGFNPDRGDTMSVVGMKFSEVPAETSTGMGWLEVLARYGWGLLAAALLAAGTGILLAVLRRADLKGPQVDLLAGEEIKIEDLLERELSPEEKERRRIREEIEKLVDRNPEDVAQLIRTWLLEEGR